MLNIIAGQNKPLSHIIRPLRKYFASGEMNYDVVATEAKMKEIAGLFPDGKIDYMEGVAIEYKDWRFNLRQ